MYFCYQAWLVSNLNCERYVEVTEKFHHSCICCSDVNRRGMHWSCFQLRLDWILRILWGRKCIWRYTTLFNLVVSSYIFLKLATNTSKRVYTWNHVRPILWYIVHSPARISQSLWVWTSLVLKFSIVAFNFCLLVLAAKFASSIRAEFTFLLKSLSL